MKKSFSCFVLIFFLLNNASAQKVTGCGFKVPPRSLAKTNFNSVYEARDILNKMLDTINWKENFNIREQNGIRNAYATILNQKRWIIYDNDFLEDIDSYASTQWASISVLAHEMGHHYYNHVVSSSGSTPPKEIEADAFSGYVLSKLGASLQQSVAAMQAIGSDYASASHPAKADRMNAISRGWNAARGTGNTSTPPANPIPTTATVPNNPTPANTNPQSDPSWIALSIQSNKAETVLLSDDGKTYQQAQIPAGQPFVFKFEVYNYGWLRLKYYNGYRTFKLLHGKDYSILWNRRTSNWSLVEVPN
ncbi:MAG: M48 family metalloprotease [Rhizobacter sp.]|nr:M48 family metalloprotease [Ferruginibacter sp.]